ncbi:MAG: type I-U CRISPR-associated protein Cas5/Cas6, partial [Desulfobacterales bacterium]|nr:type I-U CRISPR-associated protein Cas5/Cas6 [Desulfobacterales bacterium]
MLVITLQFIAGRYHATPWGRNVNEGEVEWPPSPYRLARTLVDAWRRRKPDWPEARLTPLLKALVNPPVFHLPPARASHTRAFLSSNQKDPSKKQLIFDAFVALDKRSKILMGFDADPGPDATRDLNALLDELNYLGRSESWVRAGARPAAGNE